MRCSPNTKKYLGLLRKTDNFQSCAMAAGVMTRLLFVVVLSCLLPRSETIDSEACELGTTGVSATCGVVSALFGFFGALICAGTAGAGCGAVFAGVAAWYGVCASVVGNVPCGGDGESFCF